MWAATVQGTQLNTVNGLSLLDVTVKLDNGEGVLITATIQLGAKETRLDLKRKIEVITSGIDNLNVVAADFKTSPQVDTSPTVVTDIQGQLNEELNVLNQIQNLVKLGKIAPDDNVVTDQIQKFAEVANKIIKQPVSLGRPL